MLYQTEPKAGQPLKMTLDERVQIAADGVLASQRTVSAVVAVRVSDGATARGRQRPQRRRGEPRPNRAGATGLDVQDGQRVRAAQGANAVGLGIVRRPKTFTVEGSKFHNSGTSSSARCRSATTSPSPATPRSPSSHRSSAATG